MERSAAAIPLHLPSASAFLRISEFVLRASLEELVKVAVDFCKEYSSFEDGVHRWPWALGIIRKSLIVFNLLDAETALLHRGQCLYSLGG